MFYNPFSASGTLRGFNILKRCPLFIMMAVFVIAIGGCASETQPPSVAGPATPRLHINPEIQQILLSKAGRIAILTRSEVSGGSVAIQFPDGKTQNFGTDVQTLLGWSPEGNRLLYTNNPASNQQELSSIHIYDTSTQKTTELRLDTGRVGKAIWSGDGNVILLTVATSVGTGSSAITENIDGKVISKYTFPENISPDTVYEVDGKEYFSVNVFQARSIEHWIYLYQNGRLSPIPGTFGNGEDLTHGPGNSDISFSLSKKGGQFVSIQSFDTHSSSPAITTSFSGKSLPKSVSLNSFEFAPDGHNILLDLVDNTNEPMIVLCRVTSTSYTKLANSKAATFSLDGNHVIVAGSNILGGANDCLYIENLDGSGRRKIYSPSASPGLGLTIAISLVAILGIVMGWAYIYVKRQRSQQGTRT